MGYYCTQYHRSALLPFLVKSSWNYNKSGLEIFPGRFCYKY